MITQVLCPSGTNLSLHNGYSTIKISSHLRFVTARVAKVLFSQSSVCSTRGEGGVTTPAHPRDRITPPHPLPPGQDHTSPPGQDHTCPHSQIGSTCPSCPLTGSHPLGQDHTNLPGLDHTHPLPHVGTTVYAQAGGTHPTGMHSCLLLRLHCANSDAKLNRRERVWIYSLRLRFDHHKYNVEVDVDLDAEVNVMCETRGTC